MRGQGALEHLFFVVVFGNIFHLDVHYVLAFFSFFFFKLLLTFSISPYIECVILCLLRALCRRVGALQFHYYYYY